MCSGMFSVQFAQSVWPVVNKTQVLGSATRPCGWPWQLILYFYTLLSGSFLPPDVRGTNQSSAALVIHQLNAHRVTERESLAHQGDKWFILLFVSEDDRVARPRPTALAASEIEARGTSSPLQNNQEPAREWCNSRAICPQRNRSTTNTHTYTVLHCTAAHSIALGQCGAFHSRRAQSAWT